MHTTADKNTNTPQKTPTPETKSDSQTSTSRSFTPAPHDITTSSPSKGKNDACRSNITCVFCAPFADVISFFI